MPLTLQVGADHRADQFLADDFELAEVGLGQRVDDGSRILIERGAFFLHQLRQPDLFLVLSPDRRRPG